MKKALLLLALVLVIALTGCSQQSEASSQELPASSSSMSSSGQPGKNSDVAEAYQEVKELLSSKEYKNYSDLADKVTEEDIPNLIKNGNYQVIEYYSDKANRCYKEFPDYKGTNERASEIYSEAKLCATCLATELGSAELAALGVAMNDTDSAHRYMLELKDNMKTTDKALKLFTDDINRLADDYAATL